MLSLTFALALAVFGCQEPAAPEYPKTAVLKQSGVEFGVQEILARVASHDSSLMPALDADAEYRRLYLDSPVFLEQVRAFSDALMLDAEGLPAPSVEALRAEALAWASDRGLPADADAALARSGIEIENRARLLALQRDGFGSNALRQHMLRSVPEFFGQLQISWIRVPLVDPTTGTVISEKERREIWDRLEGLGRKVQTGELEWEAAVKEHSHDPTTRGRGGRVGILDRRMTSKYEEGFLRALFADLGFRQPEGVLLRGPLLTSRWAYLVRIEAVVVGGIVDLERVRPAVERSLREHTLQQQLAELASGTDRRILLPLPR